MHKRVWRGRLGPPFVTGVVAVGLLAAAALASVLRPPVEAGRLIGARTIGPCAGPAGLDLGGAAGLGGWWQTSDRLDAAGVLVSRQLAVGRGPATTGRAELPIESSVSGPVHGVVTVVEDDGSRSQVDLVSAAAGCEVVVHETGSVIRSAILDSSAGAVLAHMVERTTRADLGTFRISLPSTGADAEARLVAPPLDAALAREIGGVWGTTLALDAANTRLAIQSCAEFACVTRVVDLTSSSEPLVLRGADQGGLLGFSGADLVTWGGCAGLPCRIHAWNLVSGRSRQLVQQAGAAALTADGRRLVALAVGARAAFPIEVDVATGRSTGLRGIPAGQRPLAPGPAAASGLEVAPDEVAFGSPGAIPVPLRPDSAAEEALP